MQFSDKPEASTFPDLTKYVKDSVVTSTTGQLLWDYSEKDKGFFTVNTDGTKAVVGFAQGKKQVLGDVTITSQSPYASIILTGVDKESTLKNAKAALLSIMARQINNGFTYFVPTGLMLDEGKTPIMLEPVRADIAFQGRKVASVQVLDQNGSLTKETVSVSNGAFHLDTGKDKTLYYKVIFQ